MGGEIGFRREERGQVRVRLFGVHRFRSQANSPGDAVDVGIYGKSRFVERKLQDDGRCFWPNPFEFHQPVKGFLIGIGFEKIQTEFAALGGDFSQHLLDARPFLVCQPRRANGVLHVGEGGIAHSFPGGESGLEGLEGFIAVIVVGILREDGRDQFVQWGKRVAPGRVAVEIEQALVDGEGIGGEVHYMKRCGGISYSVLRS